MNEVKPMTLRRNFAWTFVGNVGYAAAQWGTLTLMAKWGSAEMVGQFALGLAVTAPIYMLMNLQLRGVQATDSRNEYSFGQYFGLRTLTTTMALIVACAAVLLGGYPRSTALVIALVATSKACESIMDVVYGLLQKHERMELIAISLLLKGVGGLAAVAAVLNLNGSLVQALIGMVASWALVLVSFDLTNARKYSSVTAVLDGRVMKSLVRLSLPLGIVMMLGSLNTNIPRYFIEHYLSTASLGYFAGIAYIMVAGSTVVTALGQSSSPKLARYYSMGDYQAYRNIVRKLYMVGGAIMVGSSLGVLFFGKPLLSLLYRPEYADHVQLFFWVTLSSGIGYFASFNGYALTAAREFRIQPLILGTVTVVTFIACWVFVPNQGLLGAGYAILAGNLTHLIVSGLTLLRITKYFPLQRCE